MAKAPRKNHVSDSLPVGRPPLGVLGPDSRGRLSHTQHKGAAELLNGYPVSRRGPFSRPVLGIALAQVALAASCTESVPVEFPPSSRPAASASAEKNASKGPQRDDAATPVAMVIDEPGFPVKTHDGVLNGTAIPASRRLAADLYQRRLGDEIRMYPKAFLKRIKLRQVVLCEDLSFDAAKCVSFTDVEHGTIFMNVQSGVNDAQIRWTIHHEIFHQIDYAADGKLDPDPAWESLNPPGFRYSGDVERLQANAVEAARDDVQKGFLNRYAMASPAEDKAELYAFLVLEPNLVRRRMLDDDILRRKAAKIREMVDRFGPYSDLLIGR